MGRARSRWSGISIRANPSPTTPTGSTRPLTGPFTVNGIETGADGQSWDHKDIEAGTGFDALRAHLKDYDPAWAAAVCDLPEDAIRRVGNEFLAHAKIGGTVEIEGQTLPLRPVAIALGKSVTNGWGGYECCWARTLLACLVGALDVPGGTLGTTVRLNRPATSRFASVKPGEDGFMAQSFNPTSEEGLAGRSEKSQRL